jgi:hypothetical protein
MLFCYSMIRLEGVNWSRLISRFLKRIWISHLRASFRSNKDSSVKKERIPATQGFVILNTLLYLIPSKIRHMKGITFSNFWLWYASLNKCFKLRYLRTTGLFLARVIYPKKDPKFFSTFFSFVLSLVFKRINLKKRYVSLITLRYNGRLLIFYKRLT